MSSQFRKDMTKFLILGGMLLACYGVWSYYRNIEVNRMIDAKMSDRWRRSDMRKWAEDLDEANPGLNVSPIPGEQIK